jgi:hypothetical protein
MSAFCYCLVQLIEADNDKTRREDRWLTECRGSVML